MPIKMKKSTRKAIKMFADYPEWTCSAVAHMCGITKSAADNIRFKYKKEILAWRDRNTIPERRAEEQMELDLSQFPTVDTVKQKLQRAPRMTVDKVVDKRAITYGKFEELAEVSQRFKDSLHYFLITRNKYLAPDQQEAMELIITKLARIINGNSDYADNWKDIAGYATLVADRLEGNAR
jgi:hypothetical protein